MLYIDKLRGEVLSGDAALRQVSREFKSGAIDLFTAARRLRDAGISEPEIGEVLKP